MTTLTADCPRCGAARITFVISGWNKLSRVEFGWVSWFEVFGICRNCKRSTVHVLRLRENSVSDSVHHEKFWLNNFHLNDYFDLQGYISLKDRVAFEPPEFVPDEIAAIYREGATCASVECFNAAATMFRLCVDLVTKPLLPDSSQTDVPQPSKYQRFNLKARVEWLLEHHKLPAELADIIDNLREDGNDGAHAGTLGSDDVDDVADFANLLLQRLYTNPARLRKARERREQRRAEKEPPGE